MKLEDSILSLVCALIKVFTGALPLGKAKSKYNKKGT